MLINTNDPRVKRTRQLMMQSFMDLLLERKNIYSISVQDIAARATVNRTTFYAHFADKFAFLECWMREKFQRKLKEELPDASIANMSGLRTLILSVFDFVARTRLYMKSEEDRQFEPLFEVAMQQELYQLLFEWLNKESNSISQEIVEATSLVTSWGIFGSAVQWSRNPENRSAEAMVQDVLVVVAASLAPVLQ
ncbi:TetR/AcrR family transcriptional regulator [Paenibacillus sp. OV219]|uniref:TetR/AcrR family transcriptional regulator n=1 Tax=Paenibacillus sp. OV219 TaxID=1884377 RepID=UPI0008AB1B96|nr:TetR/AcrR family transcriptional regulator [Paenibacillus sp. OV219]SEN96479.1 transcriptional regulator, TetR family [Paenibacillus sp. OV219]